MILASTDGQRREGRALSVSEAVLDEILTAQLIVAYAGEGGDTPRLGWWRTDLASVYGGEDLFRRLLPHTWGWAVLQAVREAARRQDAALRAKANDPDRLLSLFSLGFELDERVDERLQDLKRAGTSPHDALPALGTVVPEASPEEEEAWESRPFSDWLEAQPQAGRETAPVGRRLKGQPPADPRALVGQIVGALLPLTGEYSLPHFRREA